MKSKKFLSLVMAGTLSLSLTVPAFASGNTTQINGSYAPPDIDVVVTPTAAAFINPLGLDIEVADGVTMNGQILSAPMTVMNRSVTDLKVGAEVTATVVTGSDMRFTNATTGGATAATKTVFAYLQAKQDKTLKGAEAAVDDAAVATAFGNWAPSAYSATTDLAVNGNMAASKDDLVIVRAATVTTTGSGASATTAVTYNEGSVALVRLAGDCTIPSTGAWAETTYDETDPSKVTGGDGFTVNVAYSFGPANLTKYNVTLNEVTYAGSVDGSTDALTATISASPIKAAEGDTVTLTVKAPAGATFTIGATTPKAGGASGTDPVALTHDTTNANVAVSGTSVVVSGTTGASAAATTTTITFTMPAGDVTITGAVADRTP